MSKDNKLILIATDLETRYKLKVLASKEGLLMKQYLKNIVDEKFTKSQ